MNHYKIWFAPTTSDFFSLPKSSVMLCCPTLKNKKQLGGLGHKADPWIIFWIAKSILMATANCLFSTCFLPYFWLHVLGAEGQYWMLLVSKSKHLYYKRPDCNKLPDLYKVKCVAQLRTWQIQRIPTQTLATCISNSIKAVNDAATQS